MLEWLLKILTWIWDNISHIDSIVSIIAAIFSGGALIGSVFYELIASILRLKLKKNRYKYLYLSEGRQIDQSTKYYIPTRAQKRDPCSEENINDDTIKLIPFFLKHVFKDSEHQYFIILADSGMGKTTFLLKLFFKYYMRLFKKYNIVFIPLSLESSIEKVQKIENKQATILLLDGLDEDQSAMKDYNSRLKVIYNETELFYKVIISCRTQFFPDSDREPKNTDKITGGVGDKGNEFIKYYISPFNDKEIDLYLKKKYNRFFERNKINRSKKVIDSCPQLVVRPMLLRYIDNLIADKSKKYYYAYEVYDELIAKWIRRESLGDKNREESLYKFSEMVAEHMYYEKSVYIVGNEIEKLCNEYNIQITNIVARSRSLLNRNVNGYYKFAHKSILEFILAKKAIKDAKFRKVIVLNGFAGYDMLKLFLGEMSVSYVKKILEINNDILGNRVFDFLLLSEIDLSNTKIINCCFEGCNLSKAVFRGADFVQTSLKDGNLREADLCNANLKGIDLIGANLVRADLQEADLRGAKLRSIRLNDAILKGTKFDENQIGQIENYICNLQEVKIYIEKENCFIDYGEFCRRNGKRK